ncbi:hypothetical protein ACQKWADRAFT_68305 [Trichoderma austrokoningii]
MDTGHFGKNQQKWAVEASFTRNLILRCSVLIFLLLLLLLLLLSAFKHFLFLILDWPFFSVLHLLFTLLFLTVLFFFWLTLSLLTEIILERAHHGKHFGNARALSGSLPIHSQITGTRAKRDLFCCQTDKGDCR